MKYIHNFGNVIGRLHGLPVVSSSIHSVVLGLLDGRRMADGWALSGRRWWEEMVMVCGQLIMKYLKTLFFLLYIFYKNIYFSQNLTKFKINTIIKIFNFIYHETYIIKYIFTIYLMLKFIYFHYLFALRFFENKFSEILSGALGIKSNSHTTSHTAPTPLAPPLPPHIDVGRVK